MKPDEPLTERETAPEPRVEASPGLRELRRRLLTGPSELLERALRVPGFAEPEMLLLLRNHRAPAALLQRIARDRRWARHGEVRRMLVKHPRTPLVVSRGMLPHLFWNELADVAADLRVPPLIRRQAEHLLLARLADLAIGERVALARRATRGLIARLLEDHHPRVLHSLLWNSLLIELDAVRTAQSTATPADTLRHLAAHPKWGRRRAVLLELVRNSRTPADVALRLLRRLEPRDLISLAEDDAPTLVRVAAHRRIERGRARATAVAKTARGEDA